MFQNRSHLLTRQYRDATNLQARIALHARFSTNPIGWLRWLFDQIDWPHIESLLEVGCGPGAIWKDNLDRLPDSGSMWLTDFSSGMAEAAAADLQRYPGFRFAVADAQDLPFAAESFDAVMANHMLYHLPDRPRAFSEIRRVLKSGGLFYAATNGPSHLQEMHELRQVIGITSIFGLDRDFGLDNGAVQMEPYFSEVHIRRYQDGLAITEGEPLVSYVDSVTSSGLMPDQRERLTAEIERRLATDGVIHITKDSGLFIGRKG